MLGAIFALCSAATFGLNTAFLRRGVLSGSVIQAMSITVPMGVPLFAVAVALTGGFGAFLGFDAASVLWLSLAGILHFVLGRYGNYRATRALGANLAAPVQQLSIVVALIHALVFLGEVITPLKLLGILLVIFGPMLMLRGRKKAKAAKFTPSYGEGYFWGAVCGLGYGSSPLFIKWGIGAAGVQGALAGGLVSYIAAASVIAVLFTLPGLRAHVLALDAKPARWFAASGVFVFVSQIFRYSALSLAPVSVVIPVQRLSMVFRLIFSWLLNRDHEIFGLWVYVGIALSLSGAVMLTLSTEWVTALPLPARLAGALEWSWP